MTTIAVVAACIGSTYWGFLPEWAQRVSALNRVPDEVAIVTDAPEHVRAGLDHELPISWVLPQRNWRNHAAYLVNDAIAAIGSEWVAKLDIDDLALPNYLDGVDDADADVWCVGYRINGNDIVIPQWDAAAILRASNNLLASCSPFRRWLWALAEWPDSVFDDWCFWLHAAYNDARFQTSGAIGYEYRQHPNQTTRRADLDAAHQQVKNARC